MKARLREMEAAKLGVSRVEQMLSYYRRYVQCYVQQRSSRLVAFMRGTKIDVE